MKTRNTVAAAFGALAVGALASAGAQASPFAMTEMPQGYQLQGVMEGACGGKPKEETKEKAKEASCGEEKAKMEHMSDKAKDMSDDKAQMMEKEKAKMQEASCGEKDKAKKEGSCGGAH